MQSLGNVSSLREPRYYDLDLHVKITKTKGCLMPWIKVFLRTDVPCSSESNSGDGTELLALNGLQSFSKHKFYHRPEKKKKVSVYSWITGC